MKRNALTLVLCISFLFAATAEGSPETVWSYSQRDVWIGGELVRSVLVYREQGSERLLLLGNDPRIATLLDPASGNVLRLVPDAVERSSDLLEVKTVDEGAPASGSVARTEDGIVMAATGDRTIVVSRHQSPSGVLDTDEFLADYPVWDALRVDYEPSSAAVETLRSISEPTRLDVVFATWCGDSRREVPRLLKALEVAGNPNLTVRLIGLDSEFQQPLEVIQDRRIINVPTVIVEREGIEIGRMIETPAAETVEGDLAAILTGDPVEHQGRWTREARTSHGVYELQFRNGHPGTESWEIFATERGGKLTHSVIRAPHLEREIWHRFDDKGRTEFVEITDRSREGLRRSRIRVAEDHVRVTSRGDRSGIIDQYLGLPQNCVFATGSVLSDGLECGPFAEGSAVEIVRYAVPLDGCASVGCLETVRLVRGASTQIDTDLGMIMASEILVESNEERRRVWIARDIHVPVRMESSDRRARLISFETTG